MKQASRLSEVIETGQKSQPKSPPERDLEKPVVRVGEDLEKLPEAGMRACWRENQPDQAGDSKGELKGRFPFAEIVSGDDLAFFDRDLPEAGDEEFAADDDGGDPNRTKSFPGKEDEGGSYQYLIGEGIEQFSQRGDQIELAGEVSIEPVGDRRENESHEGHDQSGSASPGCSRDENDRENKARAGDGVRKVQSCRKCVLEMGRGQSFAWRSQ